MSADDLPQSGRTQKYRRRRSGEWPGSCPNWLARCRPNPTSRNIAGHRRRRGDQHSRLGPRRDHPGHHGWEGEHTSAFSGSQVERVERLQELTGPRPVSFRRAGASHLPHRDAVAVVHSPRRRLGVRVDVVVPAVRAARELGCVESVRAEARRFRRRRRGHRVAVRRPRRGGPWSARNISTTRTWRWPAATSSGRPTPGTSGLRTSPPGRYPSGGCPIRLGHRYEHRCKPRRR